MRLLEMQLDGRAVALQPPARQEGAAVWVPAEDFSRSVGAECKDVGGQWAVCQGDLCIPLGAEDARTDDGALFARLDAFAPPLGLSWRAEDGLLAVARGGEADTGLGFGQVPPAFELPDLFSGESVASSSFRGKKTFFYMWASW